MRYYSLQSQDSGSAVDHVGIVTGGGSNGDGEGKCASGFDSLGRMKKGASALVYVHPGLFENGEKSVDVRASLCVERSVGDLYFPCEQDCDFS